MCSVHIGVRLYMQECRNLCVCGYAVCMTEPQSSCFLVSVSGRM